MAIKTITLTEDDYARLNEDCGGFCLTCGSEAYGVEPDARYYECEACGARAVFGAEELLMSGIIQFEGDE